MIITTEGECYVATLEGYDKSVNLLLSNVRRRSDDQLLSIALTLRGSEVVVCGLLPDNEVEPLGEEVAPLKDTKNKIKDEYMIWEKVLRRRLIK